MSRQRVNPDIDNTWPKRCPRCGRTTIPRNRDGRREPKPKGLNAVQAALTDGTCHRCTKPTAKSYALVGTDTLGRALPTYRAPRKKNIFTEEDAAAERQRVAKMIMDRRARGIPKEGLDPAQIGNGGLYGCQVP